MSILWRDYFKNLVQVHQERKKSEEKKKKPISSLIPSINNLTIYVTGLKI